MPHRLDLGPPRRRRITRFAVAMALAAMLAVAPAHARPQEGQPAPDVIGYDIDGRKLSLADYAGKVVVLTFWASWCPPCRKELPLLEGIARTAGKDRVQVVAINIESLDVYRKLARAMAELQIRIVRDAGDEAQKAYGVHGIPHLVIIGKDGRIVRVHRGYSEAGVDESLDDLNQALAQQTNRP